MQRTRRCLLLLASSVSKSYNIFNPLSGFAVTRIDIWTGNEEEADTKNRVTLEICDGQGQCCTTADSGLAKGSDRLIGAIDSYVEKQLLNTCAQVSLFVCLSVCLSVCLFVCLFVCLSFPLSKQ